MSGTKRLFLRKKARELRARLRAQGLRPIRIWVPDTRSRHFAEQAHRQSLAVAASPHAAEDQDFIEATSDRRPE
ncbi:MAG: antitoxin MazE family protein [Rhodoplanes sp.]